MNRKRSLLWLLLALLCGGLGVRLGLREYRRIRLTAPPPPELTAGQTAELVYSARRPHVIRAYSSAPDVLQLRVISSADGQIICRAEAVASGTAVISCEIDGRLSPAYCVSVVDPAPVPEPALAGGAYVASRTGEKYHLAGCGSAQKIKENNRIYFRTTEDAAAKGFLPCGNCLPAE